MPRVTVVVPSHGRPERLRALLDSLTEQTLEDVEVIAVHSYAEFAYPGVRCIGLGADHGGPARKRNRGWRAGSAPLVAFTDDDCRADPRWLQELVRVADAHPGAIVQGATRPDPREAHVTGPFVRSQHIDPPTLHAQACNILYPRELLEACDGFDEAFPVPAGEDTDLAQRARREIVAAPEAVVYHAVAAFSVREMIRFNHRWGDLALVIRRHPHLRSELDLGLFWRRRHLELTLAAAGLALTRRFPPAALLAAPYLRRRPRPVEVLVDACEVASVAAGAIRHRTAIL